MSLSYASTWAFAGIYFFLCLAHAFRLLRLKSQWYEIPYRSWENASDLPCDISYSPRHDWVRLMFVASVMLLNYLMPQPEDDNDCTKILQLDGVALSFDKMCMPISTQCFLASRLRVRDVLRVPSVFHVTFLVSFCGNSWRMWCSFPRCVLQHRITETAKKGWSELCCGEYEKNVDRQWDISRVTGAANLQIQLMRFLVLCKWFQVVVAFCIFTVFC